MTISSVSATPARGSPSPLVESAQSAFHYSRKISQQIVKRGWTDRLIDETLDGAVHASIAFNKATGHSATAYFRRDGSYVVCEDESGRLVQVSNRNETNWAPDSTIQNPYLPS